MFFLFLGGLFSISWCVSLFCYLLCKDNGGWKSEHFVIYMCLDLT